MLPGNCFAGFDPALSQGVFTPLEWGGFGELYPATILCKVYRTLEYLNGISNEDVSRLRSVGIRHTNQLLHRVSLDIDRKRLFKKTGITPPRLLEFAHQCTLLEVSGMDRWIPLMRRLGIVSMRDLHAQDTPQLHAKLLEAIGLAGAPTLSEVQYWISQASGLDIVEELEPERVIPVIK